MAVHLNKDDLYYKMIKDYPIRRFGVSNSTSPYTYTTSTSANIVTVQADVGWVKEGDPPTFPGEKRKPTEVEQLLASVEKVCAKGRAA